MIRTRLVLALGIAGLVLTAASASAATKIATGKYTAKLGHLTFHFKVIAYPAKGCGTHRGQHCVIALSYPTITERCTNGQTETNVFSVPNGIISRAGKFSYFQPLQDPNPLVSFKATFRGKSASGTLREKDVIDGASGPVAYCDSGTLHWHATHP